MQRIIIFITILSLGHMARGQLVTDTTTRKAEILFNQYDNKVEFQADTPPLVQISGAPEAFYTYFWEFGDGHFSFEEKPEHVYNDKGEYQVRLQVTNNYDNGKPPPSRPKTLKVGEVNEQPGPFSMEGDFQGLAMLKTREPVPNEDMVVVMRYKNDLGYASNGKLYIYYNERKFKANNFEIADVRTHHNEKPAEDMLLSAHFNTNALFASHAAWASAGMGAGMFPFYPSPGDSVRNHVFITEEESEQEFRDKLIFKFEDLAPKEERNIFFTIKTTPEMLKDTSAIVKIRGVFVPDERSESHQVRDLEMEITTSHDPNKMAVSDTRINYRLADKKRLKYKVRFQNNGEGPATTIRLDVDVPSIIDKSTLKLLDTYPECPVCPDSDSLTVSYSCIDTVFSEKQISFIFNNIYLPGSNQEGVHKYDSTKGFVRYSVKLKDKAPKINSASRTAIIFDKNEPILTNYSKTHFKPGLSLGAMLGYNSVNSLDNSRNYFIGITASPYKPHRGYLQAELQVSKGTFESSRNYEIRTELEPGIDILELTQVDEQTDFEYMDITLVPVSYRYNINRFMGVGGGVQISGRLYEEYEQTSDYEYFLEFPQNRIEPNQDKPAETFVTSKKDRTTELNPGVFAGINLGSARIGPSVGMRYIWQVNEPRNVWAFYLQWKF